MSRGQVREDSGGWTVLRRVTTARQCLWAYAMLSHGGSTQTSRPSHSSLAGTAPSLDALPAHSIHGISIRADMYTLSVKC